MNHTPESSANRFRFRAWDGKAMTFSKETADIGFWKFVSYDTTTKVMQSTGLLDRNGKEIFEGDIVKVKDEESTGYPEEIGVVAWRAETDPNYAWGWRIEWIKATPQSLMIILTGQNEIIGNIYENPDLRPSSDA